MPFNELLPFDIPTQNTQRNDDDTTTTPRNSLRKKKKQTKHMCCKYCDKKLATTLHASNHYEKMHQKHLCRSCFDNFDTQTQLEEHINSSHGLTSKNLFGCPHCVMSYLNRAGLKKHMSDEHDLRYVCIICFKSFDLETNYKNHLNVASHEQQCKVCGLYFEKRNSLEKHIKTLHKEIHIPDSYTCSLCNMEYAKLHLIKKHYLDFHNRFYCAPCNTSFESHDKINSHCLTTHDSPTSFRHHCETCNKYYDTGDGLRHHKRRKHQENEFLCEICGQEFRDRVAIRRHVLAIHEKIQHHKPSRKKVICDFCGKRILYCTMATHVKIHLGLRNVKCPQCPNSYCDTKLLKSHIDSVHNKIECKICCRWLSSNKYKRHIKVEHDVEWSFVCNYCQIYFNDEDAIQEHCNIQHPNENKPKFRMTSSYQCNICFVYLGNDLQLQRHVRELHSEKRTYYKASCCHCGKNDFLSKWNYKYHMYKYHQVPFDYQCNQCEKSFIDQSSLDKHQRFHSKSRQHFCDICNRAFESPKLMKVHKRRVHFTLTDEVCPICNKKYKGKNSLGKHLRLHSGNKPFNCDLCNIGYPTKQGLMKHWKRHKENKLSSPSQITKSSE
jgi:KRAB domain-containing zinc finger protein